jgi:uncharacterized membrane protein YhhN
MDVGAVSLGRARSSDLSTRVLIAISIIGSAAYFAEGELFDLSRGPTVFLKAIGVAMLSAIVFIRLRALDGILLSMGLAFGCLGDILLGLGSDYFTHGLASFLVGHLFYIAVFTRAFAKPFRARTGQKIAAAAIVLFSLAMLFWLWSDLGGFAIPVLAYMAVITAMGVTASFANLSTGLAAAGAMLFIFSDSLIAAGKFKDGIGLADHLIWPTYYIGQYLIAFGYLRDREQP